MHPSDLRPTGRRAADPLTLPDGRVHESHLTGWVRHPRLRASAYPDPRSGAGARPAHGVPHTARSAASSPHPGRDVADDVRHLLVAQGIARAMVSGESGGAPYALAGEDEVGSSRRDTCPWPRPGCRRSSTSCSAPL